MLRETLASRSSAAWARKANNLGQVGANIRNKRGLVLPE
jgi:hypothetical protein